MTQVLTEVAKEYVEVNKQNLAEWTKRRDSAGDAEFDEEQPPAKRVYTTDTTIEALHKMMADNPEGIFYLRDEMTGWLADLEKKGHESDRQFYLSAWSEQYYQLDRVGRGNVNAEICLSMFRNLQPEPLKKFLVQGVSDGLFQREQLLVWPDYKPFTKGVDAVPDYAAIESFAKIVRALVRYRSTA